MDSESFSLQGVRAAVPTLALMLLSVGASAASAADAPGADPSFADPNRFVSKDGAYLYRAICQGCHMPDGRGATGAGVYPALAGNPKLASPLYPALLVVGGLRAMPSFAAMLDDEQVAAVVNYVRTHFGNQYGDELQSASVKALRK
ncbi:MAG: cytochrome c [Steroidobacteraceae bacterium]